MFNPRAFGAVNSVIAGPKRGEPVSAFGAHHQEMRGRVPRKTPGGLEGVCASWPGNTEGSA